MNRIILSGRLTRDAETSYTGATQKAYCRFRLAVRESQDKSFFINVKAWNKTAEICEHFVKGQLVTIDGRLHHNSFEKDGKTYEALEVWADYVDSEKPKDEKPEDFQAIQEAIPF